MKKIASLVIVTFIITLFVSQNAFAYQAVMEHWANVRDDDYNYIGSVNEGDIVEVIGASSVYPERTEIAYNDIFGSVLTECISNTIVNDDDYNDLEYVPSGIFSKVSTDLILRDQYYNPIGGVPRGAFVEVIQLSHDYSGRMFIRYDGMVGTVLAECIEPTYADNIGSEYFEDGNDLAEPIEEFAYTGIFSKVTTDLTLRDQYYNPIGGVPKGASVEVIQKSNDYSDRMVIRYAGMIGTVLTECIEPTYADNIGSEYFIS